jgi:hypothetical protein
MNIRPVSLLSFSPRLGLSSSRFKVQRVLSSTTESLGHPVVLDNCAALAQRNMQFAARAGVLSKRRATEIDRRGHRGKFI